MASARPDDEWLYHLPAFLDRVRERGAHRIVEDLAFEVSGVLYHHRGARVPGHNATFVRHGDGERFELEVDAVGPRSAWAVFDAGYDWDFYLARAPGDAPYLAWMTDAEFDAEEADSFAGKAAAVGTGRFSFGLYLHSPSTWGALEERAGGTTAPCFVQRPSGRTVVPDGDLSAYESVLPGELLPDGDAPPDYLGCVDAHIEGE